MKTPQPGDVVTPISDYTNYSTKNQYLVLAYDPQLNALAVVNDIGQIEFIAVEDFHNITHVPIFEKICNFVNKILGI